MSFWIGQEEIQRVYAQLADKTLNNQVQVQHMTELKNRLAQVAWELVSSLPTIKELTDRETDNHHPYPSSSTRVQVDALKIEPWKFEGYGDNADLWIKELENNLESRH